MAQIAQRNIDLATRFIDRTRADPVWFARDVLNHKARPGEPTLKQDPARSWELDKVQIDLLNAVADVWRKKQGLKTVINHEGRNFITVAAMHGPGKTHTVGLCAYWFNSAFPGRIICTAPKMQQLRTRIWGALRKIHARAEPWWRTTHVINDTSVYWLRPNANKTKLEDDKNWCILAETAVQPENLAGHHERFQMVIVDEATGVPESIWPVIFAALSSGEIQILIMISNPSKNTGTFAASHLKTSEAENYFRYQIKFEDAARVSRPWAEKMIRKYGVNSPIVKIRVLGLFSDSSPMQLVPTAWTLAAIEREVRPHDGSICRIRVTVDVADGGEDETVIWVFKCYESFTIAVEMRRYNFESTTATADGGEAAVAAFNRWGGDKRRDDIVIDSLGVGTGCRDHCIKAGYNVVEYKGGESSDNPELWRCRRVQSYLCLRDALRDKELDFDEACFESSDDADEFMAQLASIEKTEGVTGERVEDLVPRSAMKAKGIASPDIADSLAMRYATQQPIRAYAPGTNALSGLGIVAADGNYSGGVD